MRNSGRGRLGGGRVGYLDIELVMLGEGAGHLHESTDLVKSKQAREDSIILRNSSRERGRVRVAVISRFLDNDYS